MFKKVLSFIIAISMALAVAVTAFPGISYAEPGDETAEEFPEKYDLRNVDGKSYVTPVRSQAPFGTCWSFATIAAVESSILAAGLTGADGRPANPQTLDLSEKQLAWFSATPIHDPSSPQNGEGQYVADFIDESSLIAFFDRGGNAALSTHALAQGIGPEHESAAPLLAYHGKNSVVDYEWLSGSSVPQKFSYSTDDDWTIPDEYRFSGSYSLREARFLTGEILQDENGFYVYNEAATEAIKKELMQHRAVQVSFYADTSMPGQDSDAQYLSENWAHYTYMPIGTNHAVTIVGWDDNYSKDNFIQGSVEVELKDGTKLTIDKAPPADGAWLVKNSWGSAESRFPGRGAGTWGIENEKGENTGYFWLSYYDQTLSNAVSYIIEEKDSSIDVVDQYDFLPISEPVYAESDTEVKTANMFTALHSEVLEQVSIYTVDPNIEVTYEIYLLHPYANTPEEGIKIAQLTKTYEYAGFHKEDISDFDILFDTSGSGRNELIITRWQQYSVVVTQKNPEGKYVWNFNTGVFSEGGGLFSFKGIVNQLESWIMKEGSWDDYYGCDGLKQETADALFSKFPEYSYENLTFDNFPIKAYCRTLDNDLGLEITGSTYLYYHTPGRDSSNLRISIHAPENTVQAIPEDDITWGILDDGKAYFSIEPGTRPSRAVLTALDGDGVHSYIYATVKGVGTFVNVAAVFKLTIVGAVFMDDFEATGGAPVYEYTGEEIKPGVSPVCNNYNLIENEDFTVSYEDNIKCGVAMVSVTGISDKLVEGSGASEAFAIVPTKCEIENIKTGSGSLTVTVKDLSEEGLTGYRVQYRAEGEEEWQEVLSPENNITIKGLKNGTNYEVKASGYILIENAPWWYDPMQYGAESDIMTATVGGNSGGGTGCFSLS